MKKIIATTVAAAVLISGSAFATNAQTGLVMGGSLGYATASGDLKANDDGADNKNGNIAGGLFAGFDYAIDPMWSVGAEWGVQYANEFSKASAAGASVKLSLLSIPLFMVGKFYIPGIDGLNVFAKAGYAYNQLGSKNTDNTGTSSTTTDNRFNPVVAAGLGYKIGQMNVFAQYQYNWLKYQAASDENTLKGKLSTISVGVSYTLPM